VARLNIEDSLFKDLRFTNLCIKLGSRRSAIGALIECWLLAQQKVSPENIAGHINQKDWDDQEIANEIIEVRLAKKIDNGFIEVTGGKDNFSWLVQKQLAAQKGGEIKAKRQKEAAERQPNGSRTASAVCPPTLSLTPTLSLNSSSNSSSVSKSGNKTKKELTIEEKDLNKKIWLVYFAAYLKRYGIEPLRNAAINSQVSKLREKVGADDAINIVKFYLTHNDSFYLKKTHEFGLCLKDAETLRTQTLRGKAITGTMVKTFEKSLQQAELNDQISTMWNEDKNVNK